MLVDMSRPPLIAEKPRSARDKILTASFDMIRSQGYAATTVDDLCRAAGVTKGAFFHHFASKEALGVAAADFWSQTTAALFASAPYHDRADPLDRVLGYVDFRASLIAGPVESFTCLVGTMVQEVFATNPAIREACEASIFGHAHTLEADIEAALETYSVTGVTAASLAAHAQAVLQGSFILAKARGGAEAAVDSIAHLKRYFMLLFKPRGGTGDVQ
jgi:TetR/AcrR family transcriptional regulator, transcriptional repressor for nem operon